MTRWGPRIAWGTSVVTISLVAGTIVLVLARSAGFSDPEESWPVDAAMALTYTPVGAVIASRRPDNWIGWTLCAIGFLTALTAFSGEYGIYALTLSDALPVGREMVWVNTWMWIPALGLSVFLILLFPNGHLPSRRWRWIAAAGICAIALSSIIIAVTPWDSLDPGVPGENPVASVTDADSLVPLVFAAGLLMIVTTIGSLIAITLRWRRARAKERLQLKWFAYAAIGFVVTQTISAVFQESWVPGLIGPVFIPIGIGIAVLRHRLYDIDRVINRTIVYALVTGSLVTVYAATVFVVSNVAAGEGDNLTVAAATLMTAALFRPLLGRVQRFVDHRFYRRKYDAEKTIDEFGTRLRQETDIDELTEDLVGVVRAAMQPAHASLWLSDKRAET
jgi:hypothetical protein